MIFVATDAAAQVKVELCLRLWEALYPYPRSPCDSLGLFVPYKLATSVEFKIKQEHAIVAYQ